MRDMVEMAKRYASAHPIEVAIGAAIAVATLFLLAAIG